MCPYERDRLLNKYQNIFPDFSTTLENVPYRPETYRHVYKKHIYIYMRLYGFEWKERLH